MFKMKSGKKVSNILDSVEVGASKQIESKQGFSQHDPEFMLKQDYVQSLKDRLQELEFENIHLEKSLRKLKHRGTKAIGTILTSTGAAALVISYFSSSLVLTYIGLGLTLWGALVFYIVPWRNTPEEITQVVTSRLIKTVDVLLASIGYRGRTIFYYKNDEEGQAQGHMFIPYDTVCELPSDDQLAKQHAFYDTSKGISIIAPSQGLVELFERELDINFATVDLAYVRENLPKLLSKDLKYVDNVSIENVDNAMQVKITGRSCAHTCDFVSKQTQLGNHLGCPVCTALALVYSKVTGKPVVIKETSVMNNSIETSYITLDV
ncbi:MAG: hypothetical protein ACRD3Z_05245 [Nitrososphaerales archaeon]